MKVHLLGKSSKNTVATVFLGWTTFDYQLGLHQNWPRIWEVHQLHQRKKGRNLLDAIASLVQCPYFLRNFTAAEEHLFCIEHWNQKPKLHENNLSFRKGSCTQGRTWGPLPPINGCQRGQHSINEVTYWHCEKGHAGKMLTPIHITQAKLCPVRARLHISILPFSTSLVSLGLRVDDPPNRGKKNRRVYKL